MASSPSKPDASPPPLKGVSQKASILAERALCIGKNCEVNYPRSPLLILRGEGAYLYDEEGEAYLDCVNNVAHVGHSHPTVVSSVTVQMSSLITNSRYLHPGLTGYARRLLAYCPSPLSVMYWVNSGSEANDLAIRLARAHTGKRGVICVDGAYHGHTSLIIDVSPYKYARELGTGERGYVRAVPQPDAFSGVRRGEPSDPALGAAYATFVEEALVGFQQDEAAEAAWRAEHNAGAASAATRLPTMALSPKASPSAAAAAAPGRPPTTISSSSSARDASSGTAWAARNTCDDGLTAGCGAFMMESILSCGGQVVPPPGYLPAVYSAVRAAGGVCIADEVQVGFGRVGAPHFWAFELQGVVPDIITIGKPMGNGVPCAAVITTAEIAASFSAEMGYFNTFAGNPVASAAANAVLDVIEAEGLAANAARVGGVLLESFRLLQERFGGRAGASPSSSGGVGSEGGSESGSGGGSGGGEASRSGRVPGCPLIGSVRGVGLMVGLEMVKDLDTREPDPETAGKIKYALLAKKILISTDGMHDNVIKLKPPMCFSEAQAQLVCKELGQAMAALEAEALAAAGAAASSSSGGSDEGGCAVS